MICFLFLFAGSLIFSLITDPDTYFMGVNHGKEWHNAPVVIAQIITRMSIFCVLFTIIIIGRSVAKDFEANIHEFVFTSPLTKFQYLFGRFTGSYLANLIAFSGLIIGFEIGFAFLDSEITGPFRIGTYILPILYTLIPNLFLLGSIFFALATLTRKMISTYLAGVGFMAFYGIIGVLLHRVDNETTKVLLDPFGITGITVLTKFWTVSEMNANLVPMSPIYLLNRIIWIGIGILVFRITFSKFKFKAFIEKKDRNFKVISNETRLKDYDIVVPETTRISASFTVIKHSFMLSGKDFRRIIFHPAFLILTFLALSQIVTNFIGGLGNSSGRIYPFTSWYIEQSLHLWMYMLPMLIFFGGMIVWRNHEYKTNEIIDTLPLPNWINYASKLLTLIGIIVVYNVLSILTGIITQVVFLDFKDIELGLYLTHFFGIDFFNYLHIAIIVLLIQTLSPNKYLGFFISAMYFALELIIFEAIGYENILLRIGRIPDYIYSNMNGFGHYAETIFWYTLYWLFFGGILAWLTILMWRKTNENILRVRLKYLASHLTKDQRNGLIILAFLFVMTGSYIAVNKYVINPYISENQFEEMQANYEKKFSQYNNVAQPTISDIFLEVDLYPHQRKADIQGRYVMYNHNDEPIREIYINLDDWNLKNVKPLNFDRNFNKKSQAAEFGFRIFELEKDLLPGDTIIMNFEYDIEPEGFTDNMPINGLVRNGTCIDLSSFSSDYFPLPGYNVNVELVSDSKRKEFKLPPKPDAPTLEEADRYQGIMHISRPNYEAKISTSGDQTVVTNGQLISKWDSDGRNYFHYKTDTIIENEIVILSANYAVEWEKYKGVDIEVFYHPNHNYNIDKIMAGLKDSYDYGSKYFSKYPYGNLRVVEVPNYMTEGAARHYPTTFIWKESEGFITRYGRDDIDIVYGIAAHENTHHWWAGIVTPAFAEGAFLLTETICQYAMAVLTEKEYGKKIGRKYVKRELESYLIRRKKDTEGEKPMIRSSIQQSYIGYKKSSSIMYALKEYIGEDSVGNALGRVVEKYQFRLMEYPLATDLIDELYKVTADSLDYLITDMFEKITLYENKVDTARIEELPDGKYKVVCNVETRKFYADSIGNQTETKMNDYIWVGLLDENDEEFYYQLHKFSEPQTELVIITETIPVKVGIDPFNILIDRNMDDNVMRL